MRFGGSYSEDELNRNWIAMKKGIMDNPVLKLKECDGNLYVVLTHFGADWDNQILSLPHGFFD